jgi:hypothetical protein
MLQERLGLNLVTSDEEVTSDELVLQSCSLAVLQSGSLEVWDSGSQGFVTVNCLVVNTGKLGTGKTMLVSSPLGELEGVQCWGILEEGTRDKGQVGEGEGVTERGREGEKECLVFSPEISLHKK